MITVKSDRRNDRVFVELMDLDGKTEKSIRQGWFGLGKDLKSRANREIKRAPKRGRVYVVRARGGRIRRHVASAPGETHANLEGKLRRSLSWKVHGSHEMEFGYGVSTTSRDRMPVHGPMVEFGTKLMAERPSLSNAIDATQRNAEQHFESEFAKEFDAR